MHACMCMATVVCDMCHNSSESQKIDVEVAM